MGSRHTWRNHLIVLRFPKGQRPRDIAHINLQTAGVYRNIHQLIIGHSYDVLLRQIVDEQPAVAIEGAVLFMGSLHSGRNHLIVLRFPKGQRPKDISQIIKLTNIAGVYQNIHQLNMVIMMYSVSNS